MKIVELELFKVPPRWLFLRILTDEGLVGWGEPVVEGRADTVETAVHELGDYLIGQDPMRIEHLWQVMHKGGFYRGGPVLTSAISGVEQALWDIKGKALGVPIYDLLGGRVRDRVRVYSWIGGDAPQDAVEQAQEQVGFGFSAFKMNATGKLGMIDNHREITAAVARVAAVREAVGDGVDIGLDFHGRVSKAMAKILVKELEPYHPMFIEEPVLPEHNEALLEIARMTTIPIATGERMFTRWGFKQILQDGAVAIIQPDLSHAGGIWEVRKIAAMAEAYDVALAPHCPLGPIALAACLQVDACSPNAIIQEQSIGIHYNTTADVLDYVANRDAVQYDNGYVCLPKEAGLGVTIDEEKVRAAAKIGHRWRNPIWLHEDGSFAEW